MPIYINLPIYSSSAVAKRNAYEWQHLFSAPLFSQYDGCRARQGLSRRQEHASLRMAGQPKKKEIIQALKAAGNVSFPGYHCPLWNNLTMGVLRK